MLPAVETRDGSLPRLVWTGREVLVLQDATAGAAFDPNAQAWRPMVPVPLLQPFAGHAVWTGRLVLLWAGGPEGLAYDPAADVWRAFDAGGLRTRSNAVVVWADGVLVGWGGFLSDGSGAQVDDGIRYRPPPA